LLTHLCFLFFNCLILKAEQEFKQKYLEEEAESDRKEMAEARKKLGQVEAAEKEDARQHAEKL
jgi:hypothetical protein